jgi:hypothetical protein
MNSSPLVGASTPHIMLIAANTPNNAPPAMRPDEMSVPRSLRNLQTSASLEL